MAVWKIGHPTRPSYGSLREKVAVHMFKCSVQIWQAICSICSTSSICAISHHSVACFRPTLNPLRSDYLGLLEVCTKSSSACRNRRLRACRIYIIGVLYQSKSSVYYLFTIYIGASFWRKYSSDGLQSSMPNIWKSQSEGSRAEQAHDGSISMSMIYYVNKGS